MGMTSAIAAVSPMGRTSAIGGAQYPQRGTENSENGRSGSRNSTAEGRYGKTDGMAAGRGRETGRNVGNFARTDGM